MTASERGGRRPKVTPQTVEKIKELEREGHSLPAIARHLNECGVPTPTEPTCHRNSAGPRGASGMSVTS